MATPMRRPSDTAIAATLGALAGLAVLAVAIGREFDLGRLDETDADRLALSDQLDTALTENRSLRDSIVGARLYGAVMATRDMDETIDALCRVEELCADAEAGAAYIDPALLRAALDGA